MGLLVLGAMEVEMGSFQRGCEVHGFVNVKEGTAETKHG